MYISLYGVLQHFTNTDCLFTTEILITFFELCCPTVYRIAAESWTFWILSPQEQQLLSGYETASGMMHLCSWYLLHLSLTHFEGSQFVSVPQIRHIGQEATILRLSAVI
jgi:hypothetical protein